MSVDFQMSLSELEKHDPILDAVFEATSDQYFLLNEQGLILKYRTRKASNFYYHAKDILHKHMKDMLPPNEAALFAKYFDIAKTFKALQTFEYSLDFQNEVKYFEARLNAVANGRHYLMIVRDISEEVDAQQSLRIAQQWKVDVFNNASAMISTKNLKGEYLSVNQAFERITGLDRNEVIGKSDFSLFSKEVAAVIRNNDKQALAADQAIELEEFVRVQQTDVVLLSTKFPLRNESGEIYATCTMSNDITRHKETEVEALHHANFDSLTGLPNRSLMLSRLSQLISEAENTNEVLAVLFIDLDDFKNINDSLGHEFGDSLLIETSERLKKVLRRDDSIGRLGGDEFLLVVRNIKGQKKLIPIINDILASFHQPFFSAGREFVLTVSIGITLFPEDGKTVLELLKNADSAMFKAKALGRDTYSFFTEEMNTAALRRLSIEEQMHNALERGELAVYFQPQIDVKSKKIMGAEALLRWNNDVLGNIPPMEFIPIAENNGLIIEFGQFVLEKSLEVLKHWQCTFDDDVRIAVNLSPKQFTDGNLISGIDQAVKKMGVVHQHLELEITEGVLITGLSSIDTALKELGSLGVVLSMDDFGTGYSSLSYLRQYPFDVVKIDRSFINGITDEIADKELVSATIAMAHRLGLKVVAEGVENKEQLAVLTKLNCDYVQGYYFGKPMPENDFYQFLTH